MKDRRQIIDDRWYARFITFSVFRRRRLLDHDHPKRILLGVLNEELGEQLEEKLQYMHDNPVRSGLVKPATDWTWGSARWYDWRRSVGVPIQWVD